MKKMYNIPIEMDGISKKFKENTVLRQINLTVGKGEIFGLLGPSGAGKTTMIKILTGQLAPTVGHSRVLGVDSQQLTNHDYTKLGLVLDNSGLYERLSCYDNLSLFADIYRIKKSQISIILKQVGLANAVKRPVNKLSKGMKQRLVLARAILHEPMILFLDEPTSGLDPKTSIEIHKLIREQTRKGTAVFLTTHNMEEAAKLCDNVALLHQGEIVEYGEPEVICRKYNHQNKIQILLGNGELKSLENNSSAGEQMKEYFLTEQVTSIHSTEPNLETVFMELTGRRLEDETL